MQQSNWQNVKKKLIFETQWKSKESQEEVGLENGENKSEEGRMRNVTNLGLAIRHSGVLISMSSADDYISKCNRLYLSFFLKHRQQSNIYVFVIPMSTFYIPEDHPVGVKGK